MSVEWCAWMHPEWSALMLLGWSVLMLLETHCTQTLEKKIFRTCAEVFSLQTRVDTNSRPVECLIRQMLGKHLC